MSRAIFRRRLLTPGSSPLSPQLPEEAADDLLGRGYSRRQLFRIAAVFSSVSAGSQFRATGVGLGWYSGSAAGCKNPYRCE